MNSSVAEYPTSELQAGLILVHGNQAESLRDLLVQWMQHHPLEPLENEVILVQSNGMAQWLKLALAGDVESEGGYGGGLGIATALEFSLPSSFIWRIYRTVLKDTLVPEVSPFDKPRLIWRLMRRLPELIKRENFAPLERFLSDDGNQRKLYQLAQKLADLFDQYQVYRSDWLRNWAEGRNELITAQGNIVPIPDEQLWQAELWQDLLLDVGGGNKKGDVNSSRASIHEEFKAHARKLPLGEKPEGLPRRVMVFGISSLPRQALEVLEVLGQWIQVFICVPNPCEHFWSDIVAGRDLLRAQYNRQQRRPRQAAPIPEALLHLHAHPLLAAWGKQGRDFIALLDELDNPSARARYETQLKAVGQQRIDLFESSGDSLMIQQLQDDIRDLRPLAETRELWPAVDPDTDHSIRFHIAHGPLREVEILHDQLLAAFYADPSLTPRDIVVMVPDIEVYAPHIQAVFGLLEPEDPRYIPYSLADRGQRKTNPLVNAFENLLNLPESRLTVSEVLDWLDVPALQKRLGLGEAGILLLQRWIRGANIRWGLDGEHRKSLGLPDNGGPGAPNSWRFGLRRMLLGYAVGAEADAWHDIEPFAEIGGLDAALLGPLVHFLDLLESTQETLSQAAAPDIWHERLTRLLADFFEVSDDQEGLILLEFERILLDWKEACLEAQLTDDLPLAIVRDYCLGQLDERGLARRFFGGALTFATLMPMRSIPFRRVCLLGMNDGDYPRIQKPLDFDLMGWDYRPGDRSRREDDRYMFMEAILAAREHLHISWVGFSINDNSERPPSVLVAQLQEHLRDGWRLKGHAEHSPEAGQKLLKAITTEHKLQPFNAAYFQPSAAPGGFFTYAHEWQPANAAGSSGKEDSLLAPMVFDEPLTLSELTQFVKAPVKSFFRFRLNVNLEPEDEAGEDQEPFLLNHLEKFLLRDEIIRCQKASLPEGEEPPVFEAVRSQLLAAREMSLQRITRRGELAGGGFGTLMGEELTENLEAQLFDYLALIANWPLAAKLPVDIGLSLETTFGRIELFDQVGELRVNLKGERARVLLVSNSLLKKNNCQHDKLIPYWISHLALHLSGLPNTTLVVSPDTVVELKPLNVHKARNLLETYLVAFREGMQRPLPLALKTAMTWLKNMNDMAEANDKAERAAAAKYQGDKYNPGDVAFDPHLARVFPDYASLVASGEFYQLAQEWLIPLMVHTEIIKGAE